MRRFLFKLILFLSISICIDYAIGIFAGKLQESSKGGTTYKDKFLMDSVSSEIIVMGSSRASHHYIAKMIEDSIGKSVYNAGMDGKGIILNYGLLLEFLQRYRPSTIIYELTPVFDWEKGDNEKYLPHLRLAYDKPGIDSIFRDVNRTEKFKMLSKSYRTNSIIPHLIFDNLFTEVDTCNGYVPLYRIYRPTADQTISRISAPELRIDPLKEKYLIRFINLCKKNNISLTFAISPTYTYHYDEYKYGIELAEKYGIPVLNVNTDMPFDDPGLFQDQSHLNDSGARKYTEWVIEQIKLADQHNQYSQP